MSTVDQWLVTWAALGVEASARLQQFYADLMSRYGEPHRYYHSGQHLVECFEHWADLRTHTVHPAEVEAALWYHDAIYDTHSNDNEAQSAVLCRETALALGASPAVAQRIHDLIMFTSHAVEPASADAAALVDVDLSILGAEPARFDEYERQIRLEYSWVPEQVFQERRVGILRQFLNRKYIFSTELFRQRYEQRARYNLKRSIRALE